EYDVPRDIFRTFFRVVANTVREVLGDAWTADIDTAWAAMLAELDSYVEAA
ncbi:MAG: globin, partial [Alphaproteobacteria bacterium]|nr:globin [Alphaproteobacteria bacterium]